MPATHVAEKLRRVDSVASARDPLEERDRVGSAVSDEEPDSDTHAELDAQSDSLCDALSDPEAEGVLDDSWLGDASVLPLED